MGLSQGLLLGKKQAIRRTPWPDCLTCRLCWRSQARTIWLSCQEALSQISNTARLSRACACWAHQHKKSIVTALTGRPSTKRSHISSRRWVGSAHQRAKRP